MGSNVARKVGERLALILWYKDFEIAEFVSALLGIVWGAFVLMPGIETFKSSPQSYAVLDSYAPEWVWGLMVLVGGMFQMYGLIIGHKRTRQLLNFGATMTWLFIGTTIGLSNPQSTGVVVYPVMALLSGWSYLRVSRLKVSNDSRVGDTGT